MMQTIEYQMQTIENEKVWRLTKKVLTLQPKLLNYHKYEKGNVYCSPDAGCAAHRGTTGKIYH